MKTIIRIGEIVGYIDGYIWDTNDGAYAILIFPNVNRTNLVKISELDVLHITQQKFYNDLFFNT